MPSELVKTLREFYAECKLPRHPKKTVQQAKAAEVQGAWLEGYKGTLSPKPAKVVKYIKLALEILGRGRASTSSWRWLCLRGDVPETSIVQPEPIWRMIVEANAGSPFQRRWLRREVMVGQVHRPLSFELHVFPIGF